MALKKEKNSLGGTKSSRKEYNAKITPKMPLEKKPNVVSGQEENQGGGLLRGRGFPLIQGWAFGHGGKVISS